MTARASGVKPFEYSSDLFEHLPSETTLNAGLHYACAPLSAALRYQSLNRITNSSAPGAYQLPIGLLGEDAFRGQPGVQAIGIEVGLRRGAKRCEVRGGIRKGDVTRW